MVLAAAQERLMVGPDGAPMSLAAAVQQAKDGDAIDLLPGDYRGAHLVLENRRLSFRGMGKRPVIHDDGKRGAHSALWTVRGGEIKVENIEFRGARSQEADGAGIRFEGGHLTIRDCAFYDNEHGVLAVNVKPPQTAELVIESSAFGMAPRVVGGLYHLLNVGRIDKLSVSGSRFQQGFEGHLIKSRARQSEIRYNFIHDGRRGGASYEVDFPAGGRVTLVGNVLGQGSASQNPVVVAYGSEGQGWDNSALYMAHNTLINYKLTPAWFLRVWRDRLPANTPVVAVNNLLVGWGIFWLGAAGQFEGNRPATLGMLRDAETQAFELAPESMWRGSGVDARNIAGQDLSPKAEFEWPAGTLAIPPGRKGWSPGAHQR